MRNIILPTLALLFIAPAIFAAEETESVVKALSFEPKTAAVSYELTHPAKVRIRIGAKDGPLLRTIVDWQERTPGAYKEEWDGMDSSGKIRLRGNHDLVSTFNYFTEDDAFLKNVDLNEIMPHPEQLIIGRFLPSLNVSRIHKAHNPKFCHDPELTVKLPANIKSSEDGYLIVKDKMPVIIDIAEKDKTWFSRERYSIHIFIDDIFLAGELEGYSPYNFVLDQNKIPEGKHLLAINYSGFADHIGVFTLPMYIKKR